MTQHDQEHTEQEEDYVEGVYADDESYNADLSDDNIADESWDETAQEESEAPAAASSKPAKKSSMFSPFNLAVVGGAVVLGLFLIWNQLSSTPETDPNNPEAAMVASAPENTPGVDPAAPTSPQMPTEMEAQEYPTPTPDPQQAQPTMPPVAEEAPPEADPAIQPPSQDPIDQPVEQTTAQPEIPGVPGGLVPDPAQVAKADPSTFDPAAPTPDVGATVPVPDPAQSVPQAEMMTAPETVAPQVPEPVTASEPTMPAPVSVQEPAPPSADLQQSTENTSPPAVSADVEALRAELDQLRAEMTTLREENTRLSESLATKPAAPEMVDHAVSPVVSEPEEKAVVIQEKRTKPAQHKIKTAKPTTTWELRSAKTGSAVLARKGQAELLPVQVGDVVSGLGRITDIRQDENGWVVQGTTGRLRQ